jgi:hypothetical protein
MNKNIEMTLIERIYAGHDVTLGFWDQNWFHQQFSEQADCIRKGRASSYKIWAEVDDALCAELGMRSGRQVMPHEVIDTREPHQCCFLLFDHPRTFTFRTTHGRLRRAMIVHNYGRAPDIQKSEPYKILQLPASIYSPEVCDAYLIVQTDKRPDLTRTQALRASQ